MEDSRDSHFALQNDGDVSHSHAGNAAIAETPIEVIPNPPDYHWGYFATYQDLQKQLKVFAKDQRFDFRIKRTTNYRTGKSGDGLPTRIDIHCCQCARGKSASRGIRRPKESLATDCPWTAKFTRTPASDWQWFFVMQRDEDGRPIMHNHAPAPFAEAFPGHRDRSKGRQRRLERHLPPLPGSVAPPPVGPAAAAVVQPTAGPADAPDGRLALLVAALSDAEARSLRDMLSRRLGEAGVNGL
ncbi:hypothetical protein GGR56DRAFT_155461 [Xylariaceae sp. FL0804]|nr:hypothetical protein GGR56DRAFT_155461 [Xylariaceae sp. FL0804]